MNSDALTPVEKHGEFYFKRDDLYAPYGDDFITGGKIRQCRHLVMSNLNEIAAKHDNVIATAASVASPQSPIVARVAKEFGLKAVIGYGNAKDITKHKAMMLCKDLDAELIQLSKTQGFNSVLYAELAKLAIIRPMFRILFGYAAMTDRDSIIGQIAAQVENVDCDVLYVPVGSAVTMAGILEGKARFKKEFEVVGLQPFGYDRSKTLLDHAPRAERYTMHLGNFSYHSLVKRDVGFDLDMIYEAKSFDMMRELADATRKNCFWVIGNSNVIR